MAKKTRTQLQNLFRQGARPSGDDFTDFIESTFNIQDDGLEKPFGADIPLKIIAYGPKQNLLDFYVDNSHKWRFNLKPSADGGVGFNIATAADDSSRLFIDSDTGDVGIGTDSPGQKLEVNGTVKATAFEGDGANLTNLSVSNIPDLPASKITSGRLAGSLTILANGNVGIGVANPGEKLEVNGTVKATAFKGNGANLTNLSASKITSGTMSGSRITSLSASKITSGTLADSLTILADGRVGIGKTNPSEKLEVNGTVKATAFKGNGANLTNLSVSNISDLPASKITSGTLGLENGNSSESSTKNQITLSYNDSNMFRHVIKTRHHSGATQGNAIDFYVWKYISLQNKDNDDEIGTLHTMTLNGGNVGIGTTSPGQKLQVNGNVKVAGRLYVNNTLSVPGGEEDLRMLRGIISDTGTISGGVGFSSTRVSTGLYDITFTTNFSSAPGASVTQIFGTFSNESSIASASGGHTTNNAVIVHLSKNMMRVKTGRSTGAVDNRFFSFIVIG